MLEALTGTGLAASAGLNAYIPLLTIGVLARFTGWIDLPSGWGWLSNGWVMGILAVLLAIEFVADKVPVVDTVNDVVQTAVRPTAGGLAFGATSGAETVTVSDPSQFFADNQWVSVASGVGIALVVHLIKSAARPAINAVTVGMGGPVVSTAEDTVSLSMSVVAIILPILVLAFLVGLVVFVVWARRRWRARRQARRAERVSGTAGGQPS